MRIFKQPVTRTLVRALLVAAVSTVSVTVWAQSGNQGGSQGAAPASTAAPPKNVSPPPADIEPGVNTSATQLSSPAPAPSAAPAPAAASGTPVGTAGAATSGTSVGTAAATKPGHATTAATPKPGAGAGKAHDSLELDTTQITGNRELPKVLYIVPWKRSDLGDLVGKPVNSLLDEVLTPVDRDVFKRQNRYYDALKPDDAKDAAGAASDPANGKH